MKPLLVTSGEPAGIGPDLCLALAGFQFPLVILGDKRLLKDRAKSLKLDINFSDYNPERPIQFKPNHLTVWSLPCKTRVTAGVLNPENAFYVLEMLSLAVDSCLQGTFSGLVTAPVHKGVLNEAGIIFTGHTEFLAERCQSDIVVMMLACQVMKVALVTTHVPLKEIAHVLSTSLIIKVIQTLHHDLKLNFNIHDPVIKVAGLNPHAGEGGHLGREEIEIIIPALTQLKQQGVKVEGPFAADTMFLSCINGSTEEQNIFVAMYHDQGLPVLKYAGFGTAVNITLGLPIIRTSVDHGTALDLAGKGKASPESLFAAVKMAASLVKKRNLLT